MFFTLAHAFWIVPLCVGIVLTVTRERLNIQDTVILVSWSLSVLWLTYIISAFLLTIVPWTEELK